MTILGKINSLIHHGGALDLEADITNKLIYIAYYIGREAAARELADSYNALIAEMRQRAAECRYHRMANEIRGDKNYIYSPDYAGDMTATFGSDATEF